MVEPDHSDLSVRRQCRLLKVPRSTLYYKPRSTTPENLELMKRIDKIHLEDPSAGSRRMVAIVSREGEAVNRKRVQRLMRLMEIESIAPRRRTTIPGEPSRVKPYLLRGLDITAANHVWCTDITYIPMRQGFLYLCVVMDWATRKVLGWCLSNTQDAGMCLSALTMALETTGCRPEILNSDQGTQYTSREWQDRLSGLGIKISMDGKRRWVDNVIVERFWRSLKYEHVYQFAYEDALEAEQRIGDWINRYNTWRPHSSLPGGCVPDEAYARKSA